MAAAVDTLSIAQNLQRAKFDRDQAEAVATEMAKLANANANAEHLATKTDLHKLQADIYKIAFSIVIANAGITFALLKLQLP